MRFAIVDDDRRDREHLAELLREYAAVNRMELETDEFPGGRELLDAYRPLAYAAVFLDIYMDGMSGVDTARALRELDRRAPIIFLTTSMEHMSAAFSLHTYDYIEKGTPKERLFRSLDELLNVHTRLLNTPRLTFVSNRTEIGVSYLDLVSVCTVGRNYLEIADAEGERWKTRLSFSSVEKELSRDDRFLTLMRGVIVNLDYVEDMGEKQCVLRGGGTLPLNIHGAKELRSCWRNYAVRAARAEAESDRRRRQ
ncbi:MAG: DNA-binding response regulator [Ruminococcaceae bacterium]|nr:DNA-binding response regulator [Oscillospiraceae bacterium]